MLPSRGFLYCPHYLGQFSLGAGGFFQSPLVRSFRRASHPDRARASIRRAIEEGWREALIRALRRTSARASCEAPSSKARASVLTARRGSAAPSPHRRPMPLPPRQKVWEAGGFFQSPLRVSSRRQIDGLRTGPCSPDPPRPSSEARRRQARSASERRCLFRG